MTISPTLTNVSNSPGKPTSGLALGLYFNVKLSHHFYFHPEGIDKGSFGEQDIVPCSLGSMDLDTLFVNGAVQRKIKALSLPLMMRYRIWKTLFVEAGPQFDVILTVKDIFKTEIDKDELTYTRKAIEQFPLAT